ncbi:MAG: hypothetical protein ACI8VC_000711 [Candidatus Endobugula sp.]|jgi:hypothetical protein
MAVTGGKITIVRHKLLDTGVCLLQTTLTKSAKMAFLIFQQRSPIYGWMGNG